MTNPNVVILAGPNGAGKSTLSESLLKGTLGIRHYVNADTLAKGLSAYNFDEMAVKAGKIMLEHLHDLAEDRANFAFETTLASRTFAPWMADLKKSGYRFHLFFRVDSVRGGVDRAGSRTCDSGRARHPRRYDSAEVSAGA